MSKVTTLVLVFITFLIIPHHTSFGQEKKKYSVSGKLIDFSNNKPIEFASVAIYKIPDTVLITGSITNNKGEFVLRNISSGKYIIKSSFIGYQTNSISIEVFNSSVNLPEPIILIASAMSLNEVQVRSTLNERQISIEKTKINVAQNISSVSGNITEVLKSQSSVSIDAENNVYLRGNKNILILIDGIPTTVSTLNSIPASNVDNIEIITNPDVKYDSEGTGGIINIVTKRQNISGISGAASLNYGIYNRVNGGLSINYSKGIWNIGVNYNGKYEKSDIHSTLTRELYSQNILIDQNIHSIQTNPTQVIALSLNARPSKKDIFTFGFKYVRPKLNNSQTIVGQQSNNSLQDIYFNRKNDITFSRKTMESNIFYKKILENNKNEISFNASFSRTKGSRPAEYYIENELLQKSFGGGAPTNMTIQADYLKSLFKTGKMEFGLKGFSRWNSFNYYFFDLDTNLNQWNLNPAFSNDLEHQEYIYSSYLMYSDSLFKKLFYKVGARLEYNSSELIQKSINDKIYNEYTFPFPFLLITHRINKSQNIAFSINRRITRPIYPQLNPFVNVIDQMTYETGNKNLEPEIQDKIELNHSLIKEKFQFRSNLYYSTTNNFISQVSMLSVPDKLILTYVNGKTQNKIGSDLDISYQFSKTFSINPGISLFYSKSTGKYNEIDLTTNNIAWTGNIKTIFKPEKKTEIQLFINYNSPIELPQFILNEIYYADLAVKRLFFDNKLTVSLTLTDIFNTRNWEINSDNIIYKLNNYSKIETRILWIGLTYNFNSFKAAKPQKSGESENGGGVIRLGQ